MWNASCGNDGAMESEESQKQASHAFHGSLEISHKTRDSHISTAPISLRRKEEITSKNDKSKSHLHKTLDTAFLGALSRVVTITYMCHIFTEKEEMCHKGGLLWAPYSVRTITYACHIYS
jgi:hypothetical protein